MDDKIKIPLLQALFSKGKDILNIQHDIEESLSNQNNLILDQLGIKKDMTSGVVDYYKKVRQLSEQIYDTRNKEREALLKLSGIQDETARNSEISIINSMKQRREAYQQELYLLNRIHGMGFVPILLISSRIYKAFIDFDKAAWDFRKTMGMTRDTAESLRKTIEMTALQYMHLGVTLEGAAAAMLSLGNEMGSTFAVSKNLLKTTSLFKSQLGIAEDDSAGVLKNLAAISKSTMESQENTAYIVANLSQAAGVPLPLIMKDIATKSEVTLTMMSRMPIQIAKSVVELRKMGTSLDQAAKASRELLNFTENVKSEMEASVLLGRGINLQRARELAYRRDLEGSTREILNITKQIDFANLDVFQQEAFARATGRSVDELLKMVQAEKQWNLARSSPELSKQVEQYEQLKASNKSLMDSNANNLKLMIEQKSNQERLTAISMKLTQIISKFSYYLLPVIDIALSIAVALIDIGVHLLILKSFGEMVFKSFSSISSVLSLMSIKSEKIVSIFSKIGNYINLNKFTQLFSMINNTSKIGKIISGTFSVVFNIGSKIASIFKGIGNFYTKVSTISGNLIKIVGMIAPKIALFLSTVGRVIPIVGWLITAFQFFKGMVDDWTNTEGQNIFYRIGSALVAGIRAIIDPFINVFKSIFNKVWSWFENSDFAPGSPSKLGMMIVEGIVACGKLMFDALTSPWRLALSWIFSKIPGMSKISQKLSNGLSGAFKTPIETSVALNEQSTLTPAVINEINNQKLKSSTKSDNENLKSANDSQELLQNILMAINKLNTNLETGKLGFYVDGQLLSATLARTSEFRNGYGSNRVKV